MYSRPAGLLERCVRRSKEPRLFGVVGRLPQRAPLEPTVEKENRLESASSDFDNSGQGQSGHTTGAKFTIPLVENKVAIMIQSGQVDIRGSGKPRPQTSESASPQGRRGRRNNAKEDANAYD